VHMQEVQFVDLSDLGHARGQRQVVGRVFEERITRYLDLVVVNVELWFGKPDWLRIRDEMDLVAALGQFESEFGSDYSAAAVRGITGYADSHKVAARTGWLVGLKSASP